LTSGPGTAAMGLKTTTVGVLIVAVILLAAAAIICSKHMCLMSDCTKRAEAKTDIADMDMTARLYEADAGQWPRELQDHVSNRRAVTG
jgi:hypothetical protein